MKTFQFKDLMINVGAAGKKARLCALNTGCLPWTGCYDWTCNTTIVPRVTVTCAQDVVLREQLAGVPGATALCFGFTPCAYPTVPHRCAFNSIQAIVANICGTGPSFVECEATTAAIPLGPPIQDDPEAVVSQLAAVKAQLQQELAAIERQQQVVSESLRPQTVADVEELQSKLRNALVELDQRKQELQKPDKSGNK